MRFLELPLPHEQTDLFGHDQAQQILLESYRSDRLHHAWLIGGQRGIGKATLAFRFARFMLTYPHRFNEDCKHAKSLTDFGDIWYQQTIIQFYPTQTSCI